MTMEINAQLHRRARCAERLPGGDPWPAGYVPPDPAQARQLEAWSAAAQDIWQTGLTPIIPRDVARQLWQRGGGDRELMELLHRQSRTAEREAAERLLCLDGGIALE